MATHKPITEEMITDLSLMGDKDFADKWGTSRQYPIRNRKRLGLPPFNNQHGIREHRFEGEIEYKYCPRDNGHWDILTNFGKANNRYDGLRGICKSHEAQRGRELYFTTGKNEKNKIWGETESGRKSKRGTWRRQRAKKSNAYVLWLPEHEKRAYEYFGARCAYCGKSMEFLKTEFDHFIPIKRGGKTHPSNMLPCCSRCNHGKGGKFHRDASEWLIEKFGEVHGNWIYSYCTTALHYLGNTNII